MFRFAHYVFGTIETHANDCDIEDMVQKDIDDDWILIDLQHGEQENDCGHERVPFNEEEATTTSTVPPLTAITSNESPIIASNPVQTIMEESWFVTPPACFNNHSNPIIIETTPFENLLIEHPSMSVFGPSLPRSHSLSSIRDSSPSSSVSSPPESSSSSSNSMVAARQQHRRQRQQEMHQRRNNQSNINLPARTGQCVFA